MKKIIKLLLSIIDIIFSIQKESKYNSITEKNKRLAFSDDYKKIEKIINNRI